MPLLKCPLGSVAGRCAYPWPSLMYVRVGLRFFKEERFNNQFPQLDGDSTGMAEAADTLGAIDDSQDDLSWSTAAE